ncbi:MAG: hypothetical protein A2X13_07575 [Bacteroidetes bacterium GWC2_33_15]|nr:MAG: hypothetical protein A2X10_01430 [Bacteroidetes bacterium GWA2_33_15]OFX48646.1 MAG: hypothetical protein A2X13_07575 [Bacteroidetes bacterium GWC2_33_15]OFX64620.1 MAG: hypothetical protein A2X15_05165 [Bacteroidetes bacterium GWB2_32_14]OFX67962.1 MAG: hypothetical protein A2X14_01610 [Bacteroidetes bacterium GWD2_33_33]HAN18194.1 hypothetical protein [Bacteroidales bacterium]
MKNFKMKRSLISILIILAVIVSCEEDNENSIFKGITETNDNGESIGSPDENDWNFSETWNETENSLFSEGYETVCDIDNSYHIIAYPNPCENIFSISFYVAENKRVAYRIVKSDYEVIFSTDSASSTVAFNLNNLNVDNEIVRVYYKVFGENCELKGHGDIKVE